MVEPGRVPHHPTPLSTRVGVLVALLVAALVLAGPPAGAQPSRRSFDQARTWSWPLDASAGAPAVLRRASIPALPWQPGHRGVDLAASPGQAVLAPVDGVVVAAGRVAGRGVVSIRSGSGWRATLEPVDPSVRAGDVVVRGQVVASVSAGTEGSHCGSTSCLHWGVRTGTGSNAAYRDPLALLRRPVALLPVPGWAGSG